MNRFDKLEWLIETCRGDFVKDSTLLREMVSWMGENDFDEFYQKLCNEWNILSPKELDKEMGIANTEI